MFKICVFAGTTEGRRLVGYLEGSNAEVTACAATEYGGELLSREGNIRVRTGRMDEAEMERFLREAGFDLVIDATHPYALEATVNISAACENAGVRYERLCRDASSLPEEAAILPDAESAAEFLSRTEGNVLLTTGSKELSAFASVPGFAERFYARVLPMEDSLRLCREAGLAPSHVIAMQGPFSKELNAALLRSLGAAYLVTKESGRAGGFIEKAEAARETGAKLVLIGRPQIGSGGLSFAETARLLGEEFGIARRPKVSVVGIGAGSEEMLTAASRQAIRGADCVIGAKRMLGLSRPGQAVFQTVSPTETAELIAAHPEYARFAVLLSGDVGFYSGAKKLLPLLRDCDVSVLPGISSLSYLCAKAGVSYENVKTVSLHGRNAAILPTVRRNGLVFALVGGENGAGALIGTLAQNGLGNAEVIVGERLSYPDEKLTRGRAAELAGTVFDPLSAVLIMNENTESAAAGLPDGAFTRSGSDKPLVPMTKSEVRAVVLSKLRLTPDSVCWDIGSGTGSVSVEMALAAPEGRVYAVEMKPDAARLTEMNAEAFGLTNVSVTEGAAPQALTGLPSPTHVFIGGSSGALRETVGLVLERNPHARIVAAAVSLETVSELTALSREMGFDETETVCLNVARARRIGGYSLMTGQNPVYVFTMQKKGEG
ncbi:MAG: precorrin-6A reductase [Clostridia bacterium]|nr:precorrin-6A reductase [Clostridia bacterium]